MADRSPGTTTVVRWMLFSAFLLLVIAFATAVLGVFRTREITLPTRFGISASELAAPLLWGTATSAVVALLGLLALTLLWLLQVRSRGDVGGRRVAVAAASLVLVPLLLYAAQMVGKWRVDQFFLTNPIESRSWPPGPAAPSGGVPTPTPIRTTGSAAPLGLYQNPYLCFAVDLPAGWRTTDDRTKMGFSGFWAPGDHPSFTIAQGTYDAAAGPTLVGALASLKSGSIGSHVLEVRDITIDGGQALWVRLSPEAEFRFVAIVISPDCGDGRRALFISTRDADDTQFEQFLDRVSLPTTPLPTPVRPSPPSPPTS